VSASQEVEDQYETMLIELNKFMEDEQMASVLTYHPSVVSANLSRRTTYDKF